MKNVFPFIILALLLILVPYIIFQPILEEEKANPTVAESVEPIVATSTPETAKPLVCDPQFEDYEDIDEFTAPSPSEVDFSTNEDALEYHGKINKIAATGPNFAGSYTAVTWICAKNCNGAAIVSAKTGAIIAYGLDSVYGYDFKPSSRLFVVNPPAELPEDSTEKTAYYEVKNDELKLICEKSINSQPSSTDEESL